MILIAKLILIVTLVVFPQSFQAAPTPEPNIGVNGYFASDRAQRGRIVQAAVVITRGNLHHDGRLNDASTLSPVTREVAIDCAGWFRCGCSMEASRGNDQSTDQK